MSFKSLLGSLSLAACVCACSFNAPLYSPSLVNAQQLKKLANPVVVASVTSAKPELETIKIRSNTMNAAQGSFSAYLKDALSSELNLVSKLGKAGDPELFAVLIENDLDTTNMATGTGTIAAKFTVKRQNKETYTKLLKATNSFPSSFMAAHAIPNAANSYPGLVQALLEALYADDDFFKAVQ